MAAILDLKKKAFTSPVHFSMCRRFESDPKLLVCHWGEAALSDPSDLKALLSADTALHFELSVAARRQDQPHPGLSLMLFISKWFISQRETRFIDMTAARFGWPAAASQQLVVLEVVMVSACALFMNAGGGWNNRAVMRGLVHGHGAHIHLDDLICEPAARRMKQSLSSLHSLSVRFEREMNLSGSTQIFISCTFRSASVLCLA